MARKVGIRELRDDASRLIEGVQKTGRPVTITNHGREVARLVPITAGIEEKLREAGLLSAWGSSGWGALKLERLRRDATSAIAALRDERDDE